MVKLNSAHSLGPILPKSHKPDIGDRWWVHKLAGIKKMSNLNICTFTGLGKSFVERWAALGRRGEMDVSDKPRTGRPHAISPEVWWKIPQDYIRNLYGSMGRRCEAVIAAEGKMTKY